MVRRRWTDEELTDAVAAATSLLGALRLLGLKPGGGQYVTVRRHIARLDLSTAHWLGRGWRRGATTPIRAAKPLSEYLVLGYHGNGPKLKRRLIREGVLDARCDACGITDWQGHPAPLQLDHRNGDRTDNRRENLRLLCPNCHALTPTYCGKNIGRARGLDVIR
jgi:hypothetical protein